MVNIDVASSDDNTGSNSVAGNWVLEQIVGNVETDVPFSAKLQEDYQQSFMSSIMVTTELDVVDSTATNFTDLMTNPGGDGLISLREAIIAANAQAGANVIELPTGNYVLTIKNGFDSGADSHDHDVTDDLVINGSGTCLLYTSPSPRDRG